jgi:YegS/Rv2252/BmrU family lipid kinase
MSASVRVILNPSAGAGSTGRKIPLLEAAFKRHNISYEFAKTERRGHATELAQKAVRDGVDAIAIVGGDGTLNEVVQAYIDSEGKPISGPDLAMIPSGTGGDFKRTLGLSGELEEAVAKLASGKTRLVDLGVVTFRKPKQGESRVRAFANIASFGLAGSIVIAVDKFKHLGGRAGFFVASLKELAQYEKPAVRVRVDGELFYEGPVVNVIMANGRYFGGGMKIAPSADAGDGLLDVVVIGDLSKMRSIGLAKKIYEGTHIGEPGIVTCRGAFIEAELAHPWLRVPCETDGEQPGFVPLSAQVHAAALTFRG